MDEYIIGKEMAELNIRVARLEAYLDQLEKTIKERKE